MNSNDVPLLREFSFGEADVHCRVNVRRGTFMLSAGPTQSSRRTRRRSNKHPNPGILYSSLSPPKALNCTRSSGGRAEGMRDRLYYKASTAAIVPRTVTRTYTHHTLQLTPYSQERTRAANLAFYTLRECRHVSQIGYVHVIIVTAVLGSPHFLGSPGVGTAREPTPCCLVTGST